MAKKKAVPKKKAEPKKKADTPEAIEPEAIKPVTVESPEDATPDLASTAAESGDAAGTDPAAESGDGTQPPKDAPPAEELPLVATSADRQNARAALMALARLESREAGLLAKSMTGNEAIAAAKLFAQLTKLREEASELATAVELRLQQLRIEATQN